MQWRYADMIEVRSIKLDGETVSFAQWRQDADRSTGFSENPQFLFAMDRYFIDHAEDNFRTFASIFYGPYPRASAVLCSEFGPVSSLVESLGVSLLMIFPQNLVNPDAGKSLLNLLERLPHLRAQIYTGSVSTVGFFEGAPESSRIEYMPVPIHPRDFHLNLSQMFGFELPKWFLEIGQ